MKNKEMDAQGAMGALIGLIVVIVGGYYFLIRPFSETTTPAETKATSVESAAPAPGTVAYEKQQACANGDASCAFDKIAGHAIVDCKNAVEARSSHTVKWNDSVFGKPVFESISWNDGAHTSLSLIGDAAEFQNDYGAMTPVTYACAYDIAGKSVISLQVFATH